MNPLHLHLVTVLGILVFKLAVMACGIFVTWMGYRLLQQGVRGEFNFKGTLSGAKADLASASPGLLFVLLGVVLMAIAVWKDKAFATTYTPSTTVESPQATPVFPSTAPHLLTTNTIQR